MSKVSGFGFRIQGLGSSFYDFRLRVYGLGLKDYSRRGEQVPSEWDQIVVFSIASIFTTRRQISTSTSTNQGCEKGDLVPISGLVACPSLFGHSNDI